MAFKKVTDFIRYVSGLNRIIFDKVAQAVNGLLIAVIGKNRTQVSSLADLPDAVGGFIILPAGTYEFLDSITTADKFITETDAIVTLLVNDSGLAPVITYTGTDPFLSTDGAGSGWVINGLSVTLTEDSASFFNITNCFLAQFTGMFISWTGTGGDIGTVQGASLATSFSTCVFSNFAVGVIIEDTPIFTMKEMSMVTDFSGGTTILTINDGVQIGNMTIDTFSVAGDASDNIFCIDPTFLGQASITNITNNLGMNKYKSDTTGTFTAVADAVENDTITSVTDSSGKAQFNFTPGGTYYVGQLVDLSTFSESTYNVSELITVVSSGSFETAIDFVAGDSGIVDSDSVTITSTSHGLSELEKLLLDTTLSIVCDGGFQIYNVTTNTFQINKAFVSTEAGTWNTGSLTQKSTHVLEEGRSVNLAFGSVNAQSNTTSITDGTYAAIDATGFSNSLVDQGIKLTDSDNAIYTVTSIESINGIIAVDLWATKSGATANYRFTVSINGAIPVFATAVYAPMEVKTSKVLTTLLLPFELDNGDTLQIMSAGDGTADDITVTDILLSVR